MRLNAIKHVGLLLLSCFIPLIAAAQQPGDPVTAVGNAEFQPLTAADLEGSRANLREAMGGLEWYLYTGPRENAERWQRYLKWTDLEAGLEAEEPDVSALQSALSRFYAEHVGLEMKRFREVRVALRDYINKVLFSDEPRARDVFQRRMDDLKEKLAAHEQEADAETRVAIGRTLGWLESGSQLPELVKDLRERFGQPNLYAQVSEKFLNAGIAESISESQYVNELILGTTIQGTAYLNGETSIDLVPNDQIATIDLALQGNIYSTNVGYNGPVTINSTGNTSVYASKRLYVDEDGLSSDYAWARATTSSTIHSISARSKLIRKVAWRRAGQSKSQAESIAAGRAQSRVAGQVDVKAGEMIAEVNQEIAEKVRLPLLRQDAFPRHVKMTTDEEQLHVEILHANTYQVAAPEPPPALSGDHDLAARVHESIVANFAESMIGGKTLTDEKVVELLEEAERDVPEELQIGPDKDPWSITFSQDQPVGVVFNDGEVKVFVRGRRFTRGEQVIQSVIEISAVYNLERVGFSSRLTRKGDVEVEYLNRTRLGVGQVAMKTFLRSKFEAVFKEEFNSEGLVLPGRWENVGPLHLRQLASEGGWLTLGWQLQDDSVRTARSE